MSINPFINASHHELAFSSQSIYPPKRGKKAPPTPIVSEKESDAQRLNVSETAKGEADNDRNEKFQSYYTDYKEKRLLEEAEQTEWEGKIHDLKMSYEEKVLSLQKEIQEREETWRREMLEQERQKKDYARRYEKLESANANLLSQKNRLEKENERINRELSFLCERHFRQEKSARESTNEILRLKIQIEILQGEKKALNWMGSMFDSFVDHIYYKNQLLDDSSSYYA